MERVGITATGGARRRSLVAAAGLILAVPTLVVWADAALAAKPVPTTTTLATAPPPPPTTAPPPPTTTAPPPPTTTTPPPGTTVPPPAVPPPTFSSPPPPPGTPLFPTGSLALVPLAVQTPSSALAVDGQQEMVPSLTMPIDPVGPSVQTGVILPSDTYAIDPGRTTRSTLPANFLALERVASTATAYIPPTGFSPGDVFMLGLATAFGCLLVAWEVAEEAEWTT